MSRTLREATLDTRAARLRLPSSRKPYWRSVEGGLQLGYRRGERGGSGAPGATSRPDTSRRRSAWPTTRPTPTA